MFGIFNRIKALENQVAIDAARYDYEVGARYRLEARLAALEESARKYLEAAENADLKGIAEAVLEKEVDRVCSEYDWEDSIQAEFKSQYEDAVIEKVEEILDDAAVAEELDKSCKDAAHKKVNRILDGGSFTIQFYA